SSCTVVRLIGGRFPTPSLVGRRETPCRAAHHQVAREPVSTAVIGGRGGVHRRILRRGLYLRALPLHHGLVTWLPARRTPGSGKAAPCLDVKTPLTRKRAWSPPSRWGFASSGSRPVPPPTVRWLRWPGTRQGFCPERRPGSCCRPGR